MSSDGTRADEQKLLIRARAVRTATHSTNTTSGVVRHLSAMTGMRRLAITEICLAPGEDLTINTDGNSEEMFIYVLEGTAILHRGIETLSLGPGDFIGIPAPSPASRIENDGSDSARTGEDLRVLCGTGTVPGTGIGTSSGPLDRI